MKYCSLLRLASVKLELTSARSIVAWTNWFYFLWHSARKRRYYESFSRFSFYSFSLSIKMPYTWVASFNYKAPLRSRLKSSRLRSSQAKTVFWSNSFYGPGVAPSDGVGLYTKISYFVNAIRLSFVISLKAAAPFTLIASTLLFTFSAALPTVDSLWEKMLIMLVSSGVIA